MKVTYRMALAMTALAFIPIWYPPYVGLTPIQSIPYYALGIFMFATPVVYDKIWGLELTDRVLL